MSVSERGCHSEIVTAYIDELSWLDYRVLGLAGREMVDHVDLVHSEASGPQTVCHVGSVVADVLAMSVDREPLIRIGERQIFEGRRQLVFDRHHDQRSAGRGKHSLYLSHTRDILRDVFKDV
jgi:hypothetical protein